jgi:hypothetical protein
MRIDETGNVGIGTAAPTASIRLTLTAASDASPYQLRLGHTDNSYNIGRNASSGLLAFYGTQSGYNGYIFGGVNGERVRIDAIGNVGIGIAPAARLHIKQAANGTSNGIRFERSDTTAHSVMYMGGDDDLYIQNQANGDINWYTNAAAAMTLKADGKLGIGTAAPATYGTLAVRLSTSTSVPVLGMSVTGTSPLLNHYITDSGSTVRTLNQIVFGTGSTNSANYQGYLAFKTASSAATPAERMRIDSSGNLLVGTISLNGGTGGITNNLSVGTTRNTGATAGKFWKFPYVDTNNSCYIVNNSNAGVYIADGNTSWTANSDERLKDIIEPIVNAAEKVSSLRAVIGKFKTDEEGKRRSFLIAQDVQAVLPEAVTASKLPNSEDNTEYLGITYTEVIPLLVAAIKELSDQNIALTNRITALEG